MIDFTRAFDSAWERMIVILFRPFDLGKWFVIGFSAFLAGLMDGGNGFHGGPVNGTGNFNKSGEGMPKFDFQVIQSNVNEAFTQAFTGIATGVIIMGALLILVLVFALVVLFYWLGTRGQFLFLDNIVRNRAEIGWPWQRYSKSANNLFLFYLLFVLAAFVIFLPMLVIGIVLGLPLYQHHRWPEGGEILGFVGLGFVWFSLALALNLAFFLFREFGVPLMFRHDLTVRAALLETWEIIKQHPGSIAVFVLLRIALSVAFVIVSVLTCCFSCCLVLIPYLGTVILLPGLVYIRCFTLDCLAQFGPRYDVWTVDVIPVNSAPSHPLTPPPPLG